MDAEKLFLAAGEAYVRLFGAVQKAMQEPNAHRALIGLAEDLDLAADWVTTQYEGRTLAQHWHELKDRG